MMGGAGGQSHEHGGSQYEDGPCATRKPVRSWPPVPPQRLYVSQHHHGAQVSVVSQGFHGPADARKPEVVRPTDNTGANAAAAYRLDGSQRRHGPFFSREPLTGRPTPLTQSHNTCGPVPPT